MKRSSLSELVRQHVRTVLREEEDKPQAPTKPTPGDVAALGKSKSTSLLSKSKNIDNVNEFQPAFKQWFEDLGFEPGKITKSIILQSVSKTMDELGYK